MGGIYGVNQVLCLPLQVDCWASHHSPASWVQSASRLSPYKPEKGLRAGTPWSGHPSEGT